MSPTLPKPLLLFNTLCILSITSFLVLVNYPLLSPFFGAHIDAHTKVRTDWDLPVTAQPYRSQLHAISPKASDRNPDLSLATIAKKWPKGNLSYCPRQPSGLVGDFKENLEYKSMAELEKKILNPNTSIPQFYNVQDGGRFQPSQCIAQQKLAVLIPFRGRHRHLSVLFNNLIPVLQRQKLDFRFFIIEQNVPSTFNRGMLFNVGFLEASKLATFDCVVFHDVDLFPVNDNVFYRCDRHPRHLISAGSKYNYSLPYRRLNGGALLMRTDTFTRINGFSNLYFGWGSEDDDIRTRLISNGFKILRYPRRVGRYFQLSHVRDEGNEENKARIQLAIEGEERQDVEGLRTTFYEVISVDLKPLLTWIRVFINMTTVLQTAPSGTQTKMEHLFQQARRFDKMNY